MSTRIQDVETFVKESLSDYERYLKELSAIYPNGKESIAEGSILANLRYTLLKKKMVAVVEGIGEVLSIVTFVEDQEIAEKISTEAYQTIVNLDLNATLTFEDAERYIMEENRAEALVLKEELDKTDLDEDAKRFLGDILDQLGDSQPEPISDEEVDKFVQNLDIN